MMHNLSGQCCEVNKQRRARLHAVAGWVTQDLEQWQFASRLDSKLGRCVPNGVSWLWVPSATTCAYLLINVCVQIDNDRSRQQQTPYMTDET